MARKKTAKFAKKQNASFVHQLLYLILGGSRKHNITACALAVFLGGILPTVSFFGSHHLIPKMYAEASGFISWAWLAIVAVIVIAGMIVSLSNIVQAMRQAGQSKFKATCYAILIEGTMLFFQSHGMVSLSLIALGIVVFLNTVATSYGLILAKEK